MTGRRISLMSQVSALEKAVSHARAIGGEAGLGRSQAELFREHLAAALTTLRWLANNAEAVRAAAARRLDVGAHPAHLAPPPRPEDAFCDGHQWSTSDMTALSAGSRTPLPMNHILRVNTGDGLQPLPEPVTSPERLRET